MREQSPARPARRYLTSTLAPTFFELLLDRRRLVLRDAFLDRLGRASTRSLASFRPRLVTSRTTLMTLILLRADFGQASP